MISRLPKSLVWALGVIILGALGSGFWEVLLRYCFISVGHGVLTIITLGISSVRDSFYVEIAKGRTDRVALFLVSFAFLFLGIWTGGLIVFIAGGPRKALLADGVGLARWVLALRWAVGLLVLCTCSIYWFRLVSIVYVTTAVDHFEQTYAICLPLLSPQERDQVRSEFARIRTKADYVAVLGKLDRKASQNNIEMPKFSIW
jgi:hypothetical protein